MSSTSALEDVPSPANSCPMWKFDAYALLLSAAWPTEPKERGSNLYCDYGQIYLKYPNDSFWEWGEHRTPFPDDPCLSNMAELDKSVPPFELPWGGIHTHPVFENVNDFVKGKGCRNFNEEHQGVTPTMFIVGQYMAAGQQWSDEDRSFWKCRANPGYLRARAC